MMVKTGFGIYSKNTFKSLKQLIPTIKDRKGKRDDPNWFSSAIKYKLRHRQRLYRQYKSSPTEINLERLVKSRREVQTMIRVAKRKQEIRIAEQTKTNPSKLFSYVNNRKPIKSKLGPLENQKGFLHINRRLATIFNEYFASVFTVEDISEIQEPSIRFEGDEEIFFKQSIVRIKMLRLGSTNLRNLNLQAQINWFL